MQVMPSRKVMPYLKRKNIHYHVFILNFENRQTQESSPENLPYFCLRTYCYVTFYFILFFPGEIAKLCVFVSELKADCTNTGTRHGGQSKGRPAYIIFVIILIIIFILIINY
jgi:hypothetical protein